MNIGKTRSTLLFTPARWRSIVDFEINGSWNNGFFINNSPKTHPQDHMSTEVVYVSSPNSNSGERYHNVITRFVYGRLSFGSNSLARPKSASLISPF